LGCRRQPGSYITAPRGEDQNYCIPVALCAHWWAITATRYPKWGQCAKLHGPLSYRTSHSRYQASPAQSTATASLLAAVSRIWRHGEPWCALDVVGSLVGLQLRMSLVGPMSQTSACFESLRTSTVDLSLNIDWIRWQATYTLETHVCYICSTTTLSGEVTTRGWLAATSKPGSVLKVEQRLPAPLYNPMG